jgi:hypothetical protein
MTELPSDRQRPCTRCWPPGHYLTGEHCVFEWLTHPRTGTPVLTIAEADGEVYWYRVQAIQDAGGRPQITVTVSVPDGCPGDSEPIRRKYYEGQGERLRRAEARLGSTPAARRAQRAPEYCVERVPSQPQCSTCGYEPRRGVR